MTEENKLRTIGIRQPTRALLEKMIDENEYLRSMNDCVKYLLESATYEEIDNTRTNIHLREDTLKRLQELKGYPTESYNDVLFRLLIKKNK